MSIGTKFIYENYVVQKNTLTGEPEGLSFTQIAEAARAMPRKQRRRQLDEQRPSQSEVDAAMRRSGRYLFPRRQTPGLNQAQQQYTGAGSALRNAANDPEALSKMTPTQRATVQTALDPLRTKPGRGGRITDAGQIGTTPTASTVARGVQSGVEAIDYDEVQKIRDRLQAAGAKVGADTSQIGITGNKALDAAIDMAGHRGKYQAGTLTGTEARRGLAAAQAAGSAAGGEAYRTHVDPEQARERAKTNAERFGFDPDSPGPSLAGMGTQQRQRLRDMGISDSDIAQYERDMATTVGAPITQALGDATRAQKARTADIAADMRTLQKAGNPYVYKRGR